MKIKRKAWFALLIPMLLVSMAFVSAPVFSEEEGEEDECRDGWITTRVGTKLTFKGMARIDVSTRQCVVTLRGCTKTDDKRKLALEIAKNQKNVKGVRNKITLCPDDEEGDLE